MSPRPTSGPPPPELPDDIVIAVRGVWRCNACLLALWMTGTPVEDCTTPVCGQDVPPLSEELKAIGRHTFGLEDE